MVGIARSKIFFYNPEVAGGLPLVFAMHYLCCNPLFVPDPNFSMLLFVLIFKFRPSPLEGFREAPR